MQPLLQYRLCCFVLLSICPFIAFAQFRQELNKPEHDNRSVHYDIVVGVNRSHFTITHHPYFYQQQDSVRSIESINSTGINMAVYLSKRLGSHFNLKTTAFDLTLKQRTFEYSLKYPNRLNKEDSVTRKSIESIYLTLPLQVKFTSDRIANFKVYMMAGVKAEYDLASNAGAKKAENLVKLKRWDYGLEAGLGFHFYLPYFVFIPELKIGWGLGNLHSRDANLKFSSVIDKINSRTITFSLMVE
jgi:Outer membrane protein beta-barrel domain